MQEPQRNSGFNSDSQCHWTCPKAPRTSSRWQQPGRPPCVLMDPSWGQARVDLGIKGDKRCFNLRGRRFCNYVPYSWRSHGRVRSHFWILRPVSAKTCLSLGDWQVLFFFPNLFFTYIRELHKCLIYFSFSGSTLVQEMRKLSDSNCTILSFA